jgi:pimeloyl-ACP methyl ester carboxylesterase
MLRASSAIALLALATLPFGLPTTPAGIAALAARLGFAAALLLSERRRRRALLGAATMFALAVLLRLHVQRAGFMYLAQIRHARPPHAARLEPSAPQGTALMDESLLGVWGARAVMAAGTMPASQTRGLDELLADGYARMRADVGEVPSPALATTLLDSHEPMLATGPKDAKLAVVFLHGWGGNWALPCWQVSVAVRRAGGRTLCPSQGFAGDWWTPSGEATVRDVIAAARADGATRVILAGLSNGGIGASRLAPRLRKSIDGLVLLSGLAPDAPPPQVRTLVVFGEDDTQVVWEGVRDQGRAYAQRTGARVIVLPGTHFVVLEQHARVVNEITVFLREGA